MIADDRRRSQKIEHGSIFCQMQGVTNLERYDPDRVNRFCLSGLLSFVKRSGMERNKDKRLFSPRQVNKYYPFNIFLVAIMFSNKNRQVKRLQFLHFADLNFAKRAHRRLKRLGQHAACVFLFVNALCKFTWLQ